MFKKVLISDDLGIVNEGVASALESLSIKKIDQVQYCDDAYLKIKAAFREDKGYDLLITDLSFQVDHRSQHFSSGEQLVECLKQEHPNLKIIVFSVENRLQMVRSLVKDYKLDAYVCKGRKGMLELKQAIRAIHKNKQYVSLQVREAIEEKTSLEISDFDLELVTKLSKGFTQDEICDSLKERNITPNSISSIEKHINKLRIQFRAHNAIHLVAIIKDLGII